MRTLLWAIAGGTLAAAVYILLNEPQPHYAGVDLDLERAAINTGAWGARQRVTGTGTSFAGKLKEGFGNATGNDHLAAEGVADQAAGKLKDVAGKAASAVGNTLHDLNRP